MTLGMVLTWTFTTITFTIPGGAKRGASDIVLVKQGDPLQLVLETDEVPWPKVQNKWTKKNDLDTGFKCHGCLVFFLGGSGLGFILPYKIASQCEKLMKLGMVLTGKFSGNKFWLLPLPATLRPGLSLKLVDWKSVNKNTTTVKNIKMVWVYIYIYV